jgi:tetratricopeptide (TPR) repeat protein
MRAGSALEVVRRTREAGPYLERAVRQRPADPDAAYRLGLHQFNEGLFEEAAAILARGREIAPQRPDMALKLAQSLNNLARFPEALAVLDDALSRSPDEPLLTFQRGVLRNRSGDAEGAVGDFRRVLELDPEQNRARYALARALAAAGRPEEGQAVMAEFAAQEEEERQRKTAQLVAGLARAGGDDDPVQNRLRLEELVLSNPKNPEAHRLLAAAYAREGDYLRAADSYARAVRLDPEDAGSARRREELLRRLGQTVPPPAGPGP